MARRYTFLFFALFICFFGCKEPDPKPQPPNLSNPPSSYDSIYEPSSYSINVPFYLKKFKVPENNLTTNKGVELGRMLFYEKMLSIDNSVSCASCHKQELAFSDGNKVSIGIFNKKGSRSSMALNNLLWLDSTFFWDGRAKSLEHQAMFPIQDSLEMGLSINEMVSKLQKSKLYSLKFNAAFNTRIITSDLVFKALAQFERTLISLDSKYDKYILGNYSLTAQESRGMKLFLQHPIPGNNPAIRGGNCGDCHGGFLFTFNRFHVNGLDAVHVDLGRFNFTKNDADKGKMRAPSLRNIALTAPYMHDGRFNTLEEVLDHYSDHVQLSNTLDPLIREATNELGEKKLLLSSTEKKDIIAFLKILTDSTFISNPNHSNPFK